jgi:hypothetical protein
MPDGCVSVEDFLYVLVVVVTHRLEFNNGTCMRTKVP